ncbi:MAG: redoxin domain-containing protein, partial [Maritimibacter sp.]
MAATPPICDFGAPIHDFTLPEPATGNAVSLADVRGENGTLVMFICNHCPYVKAVIDRITRDAKDLQALGIGVVAISANDVADYPQDAPEHMAALAAEQGFSFPYL